LRLRLRLRTGSQDSIEFGGQAELTAPAKRAAASKP
jgi:hypothetical protein